MRNNLAVLGLLVFLASCSKELEIAVGGKVGMYDSGYDASSGQWLKFLQCWESETIKQLSEIGVATDLEQTIISRNQQKFPPATEYGIHKKEQELHIKLPKSYRDFLLASNGWIQPRLDDDDGQVLPVESIGYFPEIYPSEFKQLYNSSLGNLGANDRDYSEEQESTRFDNNDLASSIAISDFVNSGVYLINLNQLSPENEWSIWFYSSKHPGVYKFVSFAHLMQYAYIKAIHEPDDDVPYGYSYIKGTCAELLGFPKLLDQHNGRDQS